jgi:hypothetical protein
VAYRIRTYRSDESSGQADVLGKSDGVDSVVVTGRRGDQISRTLADNVCMGDVALVGIDLIGRIERL